VLIRPATEADLEEVGEITVAAYADFTLGPTDPYIERLRDARSRFDEAELWVAILDDRVVGSVTRCPTGSSWHEVARDGEGEFRMLAVAPEARGMGVGSALTRHVLDRCRAAGETAVVISSLREMRAAHRIYTGLGFRRTPERDWSPMPGVWLITFVLDLQEA
jgi:ribosomal protein S18 acetylase RimI-like enzyme